MKRLPLLNFVSTIVFTVLLVGSVDAQHREVRKVSGFTGIALSTAADIYISQASEYKFEIEADADILKEIETEVVGDILKIRNRDHFNFSFHNEKVKIYVSMPIIGSLGISGSGDIIAQTNIKSDDLRVKISGSGNVKIDNFSVKNLDMEISGSGDIYMAGTDVAESATYSISGSGDINNENLQCKKVTVHVSGSGDVKVWAADELTARVSGSGDIYYKGRPIVHARTSGSGGIHYIK